MRDIDSEIEPIRLTKREHPLSPRTYGSTENECSMFSSEKGTLTPKLSTSGHTSHARLELRCHMRSDMRRHLKRTGDPQVTRHDPR